MTLYKYDVEFDDNMMPSLVRDGQALAYDGRAQLTSADRVRDFLMAEMRLHKKTEEHVIAIALNNRCKPLAVFDVSHGSATSSYLTPREVMQRLLLAGTLGFIIAHNHPSGVPEPSHEDVNATDELKKAAGIMHIALLDHVIVAADGSYYSFRENNNVIRRQE